MKCCVSPFRKIFKKRSKSTTAIPDGAIDKKDVSKTTKTLSKSDINLNKLNPDSLTEVSTQINSGTKPDDAKKSTTIPSTKLNGTVGNISTSDDDDETKKLFNQSWNQLIVKNHQNFLHQEAQLKEYNIEPTKQITNEQDYYDDNVDNFRTEKNTKSNNFEDSNNNENQLIIDNLKKEIKSLRNIVHRLNHELSNSNKNKHDNTMIPNEGPAPSWLINAKLLSPLIAAYEERLEERDKKIKSIRKELNEFNSKIKILVNENIELYKELDALNLRSTSKAGSSYDNKLDEWEQIRRHAHLVLEENQLLKDYIDLNRQKHLDFEKSLSNYKGRVLILESDKLELISYIEKLKQDYTQVERKNIELLESSKKNIKWDDYLKKVEEFKEKIACLNSDHLKEIEQLDEKLRESDKNRNMFEIRLNKEINEIKRLSAEIVLVETLLKKKDKKLKLHQKKLQLFELKEKIAMNYLIKLSGNIKQLKFENNAYENIINTKNEEKKNYNNKIALENLKIAKLEEKLETIKLKAQTKLEKSENKIREKDNEFILNRIEYNKKSEDFLTILRRKDNEIQDILENKKQLEEDIETIWRLSKHGSHQLNDLKDDNESLLFSKTA